MKRLHRSDSYGQFADLNQVTVHILRHCIQFDHLFTTANELLIDFTSLICSFDQQNEINWKHSIFYREFLWDWNLNYWLWSHQRMIHQFKISGATLIFTPYFIKMSKFKNKTKQNLYNKTLELVLVISEDIDSFGSHLWLKSCRVSLPLIFIDLASNWLLNYCRCGRMFCQTTLSCFWLRASLYQW